LLASGNAYDAVPCSVAVVVVAQAPPPSTGSNVELTLGSPPVDVTVCAWAERSTSCPGLSASQLGAVNGPPDFAVLGQVWVRTAVRPLDSRIGAGAWAFGTASPSSTYCAPW